jgi:hypothetical protein
MAFYTRANTPAGNHPLAPVKRGPGRLKPLLPRGTAKSPGRVQAGPAPKVDKPRIFRENPGIVRRPSNGKVF